MTPNPWPATAGGLIASLLLSGLSGCSACDPTKSPRPAASSGALSGQAASASASASASAPAPVAPPLERRSLPEREPLDSASILANRDEVLTGLKDAAALRKKDDARGAVAALVALGERDPLGGVVALSLAQAALAAGDFPLAARAARGGVAAGAARDALLGDAARVLGEALEKLERPAEAVAAYETALAARRDDAAARKLMERLVPAGPVSAAAPAILHAPDFDQARAAVERAVRGGTVPLVFSSGSDAKAITSVREATLEVEAPSLPRAHVLRVDVSGARGSDRLIWVEVEGAGGVDVYGPVATVFSVPSVGAVNDVVVDLQKIDVLPGGAPEIVVKVVERRTLPDVALGEVAEVDVTRAVLLTVDRGGLQVSRAVTLSSRSSRTRLDAKATRMPAGFTAGPAGGRTVDFGMKVAWSGPNEMTLTKVSGNSDPVLSGPITLFP